MIDRIMGVFRLDADTFSQIEHDESATSQAALIVLAVGLLGAIGGAIGALIGDGNAILTFILQLIGAFIGWALWAAVTYFVGTNFFQGKADIGEMLRVTGFAQAPQLLSLLSFIPCIGGLIALAGWIWSLAAMVVGIREGLDIDTTQALVTGFIGWVLVVIIKVVVGLTVGGMAAMFGGLFGG